MYKDKDKMGYIYIIHCADSTYYKIGITYSGIDSRLQALQTGCPHKLVIAMMFATPNPEEDEHKLHKLCNDCQVRGEWFDLSPQMYCNVILAINPLMVDYMSHSPMKVGYVPPKND